MGRIHRVHRLVTAAELRALHTTPVELVRAPAEAQLLWPVVFVQTFTPGAVPFDGLDSTILAWGPAPPGGYEISSTMSTGAVTNAARINALDVGADIRDNVVPVTPSVVKGKALLLVDASAVGSTEGDGTLSVDLSYLVLTP